MVSFGLIDEWEPRIGRLTSWTMSQTAVTAAAGAPIHPVPPSHQQEAYLRAAQRNQSAGFRFSRLCLQAFDFHSPLDADALTRTIDAFLRRHDTFRCWFSEEPDAPSHATSRPGDHLDDPHDTRGHGLGLSDS